MTLSEYVTSLIHGIPFEVYIIEFLILCIGSAIFVGIKGFEKGLRFSLTLFLCEYVFLVISSTVLLRESRSYDLLRFTPFGSYDQPELLNENIMNVVVFLPVGLFYGMGNERCLWWKALGLGCLVSILIEILQFVLKRGCCEIDDVIHNTAGCLIGYGLFKISQLLLVYYSKRMKERGDSTCFTEKLSQ